jgi:hypothetical protein
MIVPLIAVHRDVVSGRVTAPVTLLELRKSAFVTL